MPIYILPDWFENEWGKERTLSVLTPTQRFIMGREKHK